MATSGLPAHLGQPMPAFELPTVAGDAVVTAASFSDRVTVVMFICNHCPYVRAIEDRMIALVRKYEGQGVRFVGIAANDAAAYPEDAPAALAERAQAKGYGFTYLYDESQAVARAFDAACTPEFYVYGTDRRLLYRGRFDDSRKEPSQVQTQDLARAIDAALAGQPLAGPQHPALGCSIKWRA